MAQNAQGEFIWYELMTRDVEAAASFYSSVVGWSCQLFDPGDPKSYRIFKSGADEVGGLMPLPEGNSCQNAEPGWIGYIGVEDVDAMAADLLADGASQLMPPTDIPGVGRFAVLADPQGAVFTIMRGAIDARSTAFSPHETGHCQWNELSTSDADGAFGFYSRHFGWTKGEAMLMGDLGVYQMLDHQGMTMGAIMRNPEAERRPAWGFYFGVDDVDAATTRATVAGGKLLHGPTEVPGGSFIIHATDPQGARFALVGPRLSP
jgi:predicted enzyme related to lactoylglutathione lyase